MRKRRRWLGYALILLVAAGIAGRAPGAARGASQAGQAEGQTYLIDIASSSALPGVLFASVSQDPWRKPLPPRYSLDGGVSWRELPPGGWVGGQDLQVAVQPRPDPAAPIRFIVGAGGEAGGMSGTPRLGMYRTGDGGRSWRLDAYHLNVDGCVWRQFPFYRFIDSPVARPTLYATYTNSVASGCPDGGGDIYYSFGGMIKSDDYGATWREFTFPADSFVLSPVLPDRVYGFKNGAWARSDDGGATWQATAIPPGRLRLDARDSMLMYLGTAAGWQRSRDGGATWAALPPSPCSSSEQQRSLLPAAGMILINCPEPAGMYRSADAGDTWQRIGPALDGLDFSHMQADHGHPGRLLRTVNKNELWASDDYAATWFRLSVFRPFLRTYVPLVSSF